MPIRVQHLTEKDYKTSSWSGGTTRELFIYPRGADYSSRHFTFRISSATVDLPESDFTPLAGVTRFITPLSGGFTLTHPQPHNPQSLASTSPSSKTEAEAAADVASASSSLSMRPLSPPYCFSGETPTHCVGKATDFNLMLKGCDGEMFVIRGGRGEGEEESDDGDRRAPIRFGGEGKEKKKGFVAVFATDDDATFLVNTDSYTLKRGEMLTAFYGGGAAGHASVEEQPPSTTTIDIVGSHRAIVCRVDNVSEF